MSDDDLASRLVFALRAAAATEIGAHDSALAFDRASVRHIDKDGRLHVAVSNLSRAAVNEYYGEEIPGWEKLGLQPKRIYAVFRDPAELAKSVSTFNNLPILSEHVPVSAASHRPELVIGSTGTSAAFDGEFLTNALVFWTQSAIDEIESGAKSELSASYAYVPVVESGEFNGKRFQIRMSAICGNHIAAVASGRIGPAAIVADGALNRPRGMFHNFILDER